MRFDRSRGGRGGGRFGDRRPRYDLPKPVKVGEEYDVEILETGSKGDGVARIKNFVVFVAGAKKGEKIKIKIKEVSGRFATAEKVGAVSKATEEEPAEAEEEAEPEEAEPEEEAEEESFEEPLEADVEEEAEPEAESEEPEEEADLGEVDIEETEE